MGKTLTFAIMEPPYEAARSTTAFRLIDAALSAGHDVNVFAYEGAVSLTNSKQTPHANAIHGTTVDTEQHPTTKDWVSALFKKGDGQDGRPKLDWVLCGLCMDERGATENVPGPRRGSPADFVKFIAASHNLVAIGTR